MDATRYVPAAGRAWLTPVYDRVVSLTMREGAFRGRLAEQVLDGLAGDGVVVDVGCGTGTFAARLAADHPGLAITAIDGDDDALDIARGKAPTGVRWMHGLATHLPVLGASADRVVMSLLLHHLVPAQKERALREAVRVLHPGGRLHVADWGRPQDPVMRGAFLALQVIDGFENTRDHVAGRLTGMLEDAGLEDVQVHDRMRTGWGTLELLEGVRPR